MVQRRESELSLGNSQLIATQAEVRLDVGLGANNIADCLNPVLIQHLSQVEGIGDCSGGHLGSC